MIPKPEPFVVQGNEEKVGPLQLLQHRVAAAPARYGIAQGPAEAIEDGGLEQEGLDVIGLFPQYLFGQVVEYVAVGTGEGRNEAGDILLSSYGERGQLQPGDPALGALSQRRGVLARKVQTHRLVEEGGRLLGSEAQVGGSELREVTAGQQTRQGKGWIGAAGDDQVHLRRHVLKQEGDGVVDGL